MNPHQSIAVIGLGFVGLQLSARFLRKRFKVYGIEIEEKNFGDISFKFNKEVHFANAVIDKHVETGQFKISKNFSKVRNVDTIIICVPMPYSKAGIPDLSLINLVMKRIKPYLKKGQLICLEHVTNCTEVEAFIISELSAKGFCIGEDFFLAYAPRRIQPVGIEQYKIPKVIDGATKNCAKKARIVYRSIFDYVVPRFSTSTIAFQKRLANMPLYIKDFNDFCEKEQLDFFEVIDAENKKTYGFLHYIPDGLHGNFCVPVDPLYLIWKANQIYKKDDVIHKMMPYYMSNKIKEYLISNKVKNIGKLLILGITNRPNVADIRESVALCVMKDLQQCGFDMDYYDPYIPMVEIAAKRYDSITLSTISPTAYDIVVVLIDHHSTPYEYISSIVTNILDGRVFF